MPMYVANIAIAPWAKFEHVRRLPDDDQAERDERVHDALGEAPEDVVHERRSEKGAHSTTTPR